MEDRTSYRHCEDEHIGATMEKILTTAKSLKLEMGLAGTTN